MDRTDGENANDVYATWTNWVSGLNGSWTAVRGNHDYVSNYTVHVTNSLDHYRDTNGWRLVFFDSPLTTNDHTEHGGDLDGAQLTWLSNTFAEAVSSNLAIMTFTHVTTHSKQFSISWI